MWRLVVTATIVVLTAAVAIPTASAQDDGVFFDDPDSPGGKEYAIPLERARREGGDRRRASGRQPAPRFGAGIRDSGGNGDGGNGGSAEGGSGGADGAGQDEGSSGRGRDAGGSERGRDRKGEGDAAGDGDGPTEAATAGSGGGLPPALSLSGVAAGVLLAGTALGLGLRRLRRHHNQG